jgi:cytochrome b6-f complex iron-sulfur subunit
MPEKQSRRKFCGHAASFITISALLEGCGGSPTSPSSGNTTALPTISATVTGNTITLPLDSAADLASVGSAALVRSGSVNVLVARTAQETFSALTAVCTHESCTVDGYQGGTFTCPCHGSQFDTAGAVVRGPANRALRRYTTSFANNVLTISLS